jgi:quercetin dioxygenase-like cupin family protein
MPLVTRSEADIFETHGVRFTSYVRPSRGSRALCTWRVDVPPGQAGAPHRPTREEVICCIEGRLELTLDGTQHILHPGDVAYVRADTEVRLDGGPDGGAAWTTTLAGLDAVMSDGSLLQPAWTR